MRRSIQFLLFTAVCLTAFLLLPLHARYEQRHPEGLSKRLVPQLKRLQITDLCLVTEARYTRHPALADRHAPFQDHPGALEHFPSGSLILPGDHSGATP
ncbi:MAG: hypothetical protein PHI31_11110 [Desulfuromonadaceae bacterium]|nr:hypothetical protein [Desulfuromonadaceae bacterium]